MTSTDVTVRLATRADVPGVMALESRYYVGNLDATEQEDGFISVLHSADWFYRAFDTAGLHVAVTDDDAVAGFIAVTPPPPRFDPGLPSIVRAMLDLADTLDFNGRPIAQQRFAFRGPVCIDKSARGRGVYSKFNTVTREAYRGRFDCGVLFVAADNVRSLHTTTTKLEATSLAVFGVDGRQFHFLAFDF